MYATAESQYMIQLESVMHEPNILISYFPHNDLGHTLALLSHLNNDLQWNSNNVKMNKFNELQD